MITNFNTKQIQLKIVYYGCAMSGKTTSLRSLFTTFNKSNQLVSIETTTGRTLFFDFGTLLLKGAGWAVKVKMYSATGQDFYAATRPATLSGADGIIFVVDSQKKYLIDNIKSWNELHYYYSENIYKIPIIINMNKQDLGDLIQINEIIPLLEVHKFEHIDIIKTIALESKGILESFKKMLEFIFPTIIIR
jgi:signal recognition particle receptor subunit beta